MKISANSIRGGMVIEHEGKQWMVIKNQVVQPGKGGAFMQVEMRSIDGGNKSQARWRTADTVERLDVREIDCSYLFREGDMLTFMDSATYDQFGIPAEMLGEQVAFLHPVVKGQTAASSYKPGLLENGLKVLIPPFIEAGTKIVVNTEDTSYVERAK